MLQTQGSGIRVKSGRKARVDFGDRFADRAADERKRLLGGQGRLRHAVRRIIVEAGVLTPQIAARIPLSEAAAALALAESRTVLGKVVIVAEVSS